MKIQKYTIHIVIIINIIFFIITIRIFILLREFYEHKEIKLQF